MHKKRSILIIPYESLDIIIEFIVNRYPHLHNYMVNITIENAFKNYKLNSRILRIVNFFTLSIMMYAAYFIVESASGKHVSLGNLFLPFIIGFSILLPLIIFFYQRKLNQE